MLRSLIDTLRIARLRMRVSPEGISQEEVSFIYNVFKIKCEELNEFNRGTMTSIPVEIDPTKIIFYRHNSGTSETVKFTRLVDIAFDLGGVKAADNVSPELVSDIYKIKEKNLMDSMTKLKGIPRLLHYKENFEQGESSGRSIYAMFKPPNGRNDRYMDDVKLMRSSLTKATMKRPYFDYKLKPDTQNLKDWIMPLDFNKNFDVRLIGAYFGEEAIDVKEDLVDENLADRLLYGFDGFLSNRQKVKA